MAISEASIATFLDQLAQKNPTPGGGASAALTGAVAASTAAMALAYSVRPKSNPPDTAAAIDAARGLLVALSGQLAAMADEDAAAYARLNELQKLPVDDPRRLSELPVAVLGAVNAPLDGARHCLHILRICSEMADLCSKWLVSDLAIGADLAETAVRACAWNVTINLSQVEVDTVREQLRGELAQICEAAVVLRRHITGICSRRIS